MLNIKKDFPWFKNNKNYIYFDSAATSLKPSCMIEATNFYYSNLSTNSHNTDSLINFKTNSIIDETRKLLSNLISCDENEIIFNSGATEGLSLVANAFKKILKKDDEIILNYGEHSSNLVPWIEACKYTKSKIKYAGKDISKIENEIFSLLTKKTRIVSFANVMNMFGNKINYELLCKKIKKFNKNIFIVIDATQGMCHKPVNVKKNNIDFLVFSAHKMMGPTGMGCLYIKEEHQNIIEPLKFGGGMNSIVTNNDFKYAAKYDKYEGGTPNIAGILGWNAAIKYINNIGWKTIEKHEEHLQKYLLSELKKLSFIKLYYEKQNYPIIMFNHKDVFSQDFCQYLSSQKVICRSGVSCARLINKIINCDSVIRISLYLYNDKNDIDNFIKILKKYKRGDELSSLI